MKLSILIPTTPDRFEVLSRLLHLLRQQIGDADTITSDDIKSIYSKDVEILIYNTPLAAEGGPSIGQKRQRLLNIAQGEYVSFFDSDDMPKDEYISEIMKGIYLGVDCCSLKGIYYINSVPVKPFIHSIRFQKYDENDQFFERYPNHLNAIRADIAKRFRFVNKNHGEDTEWATQIYKSGRLKTEFYIEDVIYHYYDKTNK